MQGKYRKKAGITVFLTMILLLTSSFFFTLLEAARMKGLDTKAETVQILALESVFAEYQRSIYENYDLLLLNGSLGGEEFQIQNAQRRLEEKNVRNLYGLRGETREFYQMEISECRIPRYQLVTDDEGRVFRKLAAQSMRRAAASSLLEDFSDKIQEKESLESKNGNIEDYIEEAEKAESAAIQSEKKNGNDISALKDQSEVKNPIKEAKKWKKSGVLSMTVRDESRLSNKGISLENTLARRNKKEGNLPAENKALDEMWFLKYLEEHMGAYGKILPNHVLDYEMEYILCGMSTDRENIEKTVKNLILIREILNLASLLKDGEKCIEAEELAAALMGWTVNPAVVEVTKWGILGAWAYVESILDVRALLEGNKIAWIKSSEQWTSGIGGAEENMEGFSMAKDCENGWDYITYLKFLLCLQKDKDINYRSIDVIEVNTNVLEEERIRMDEMIVTVQTEVCYEAKPLFWKYVHMDVLGLERMSIRKKGYCSYL